MNMSARSPGLVCRYGSHLRLLREDAAEELPLLLKGVKAALSTQRITPASGLRILSVLSLPCLNMHALSIAFH